MNVFKNKLTHYLNFVRGRYPAQKQAVRRVETRTGQWQRVEVEEWNPSVSTELFARVFEYSLTNPHSEVAWRMHINEETNALDYTTSILAKGGGADVTITAEQDKVGFDEAKADGFVCNVHVHTHPDFSAYFSAIDLSQQRMVLEEECTRFYPGGGVVYFLVIGHTGVSWNMRRIEWKPSGEEKKWDVKYCDKWVALPSGALLWKAQRLNNSAKTGVQVKKIGDNTTPAITGYIEWQDWSLENEVWRNNGYKVQQGALPLDSIEDDDDEFVDEEVLDALTGLNGAELIEIIEYLEDESLLVDVSEMDSNELFWIAHDAVSMDLYNRGGEAKNLVEFILGLDAEEDENIMLLRYMLLNTPYLGRIDEFVQDAEDIMGIDPATLYDMQSQWQDLIDTLVYFSEAASEAAEEE